MCDTELTQVRRLQHAVVTAEYFHTLVPVGPLLPVPFARER